MKRVVAFRNNHEQRQQQQQVTSTRETFLDLSTLQRWATLSFFVVSQSPLFSVVVVGKVFQLEELVSIRIRVELLTKNLWLEELPPQVQPAEFTLTTESSVPCKRNTTPTLMHVRKRFVGVRRVKQQQRRHILFRQRKTKKFDSQSVFILIVHPILFRLYPQVISLPS